MKKKTRGVFIVFEGIDGSGKSTQTKMLFEYLEGKGYDAVKIDFPQHGLKSAGPVDEYLTGRYGSAKEVGPYIASIFYACDRYDASFKIRKWLKDGKIVIADRYLASNIGHQGGKIKNEQKWREYVRWLYELEYKIFGIPKPKLTILFNNTSDFSMKLCHKIVDKEKLAKRQAYLGGKKWDIHEKDKIHLNDAAVSFLRVVKEFPNDFRVVQCVESGNLLSPAEIHKKVIKIIDKIF